MAAQDLLVKIGADTSAFNDTLAGLSQDLIGKLGAINPAVAGVVGVLAGVGIAAVNVASSWEDATHTLIQRTGETGAALDGLKSDWEAVFKTGDEDAAAVAEAVSGIHVALGLTGDQLQLVSRNFLDLAGVTGEQVEPLIKATTAAFNDWKIAGDDVAKSQDFLLKVNQATGTSVTELSGTLSSSGSTLRQLGLDFETSATLIGQLGKVGPGASEAMGALTKAVANLTEKGVPAKDALTSIIDSIKNAPNDTAAASIAMDVFGNRAGAKLAEQIKSGRFEIDALTESLKSNTTTISDIDNATDGFSAKLQELWNNLQPILVPLGETLIHAGTAVLDMFTELARGVGEGSTAFSGLLEWLQPVTDAFQNYVAPAVEKVGLLLAGLAGGIITTVLIPSLQFLYSSVLVPLAGFLRDVFVLNIELVFGAIGKFVDILGKIPGVSSLVEGAQKALNSALGDSKTKTDDAHASTTKLDAAHTELGKTLNTKTKPAIAGVIGQLGDKKEKTDLATKATKLLEDAESVLGATWKTLVTPQAKSLVQAQSDLQKAKDKVKDSAEALQKAEDALRKSLGDTHTSSKDLKASTEALESAKKNAKSATDSLKLAEDNLSLSTKKAKEDADALAKSIGLMTDELAKLPLDIGPGVTSSLGDINSNIGTLMASMKTAQTDAYDTQLALQRMGVTAKEDIAALATQASTDFATIRDSGTASATEIREAHIKELEAIKAAYIAQGTNLPPEQQKTLDALLAQQESFKTGSTGTSGVFTKWADGIKSLTGTLGSSMISTLFTAPSSFGGSLMDKLNTIKDSFVDVFTTQIGGVLDNFIEKGLKAVMGALDGLIGKLTGSDGVSNALDKVFGVATDTATSVGTTAATGAANTAANTATSTAGKAAGTGISAMVGVVSGVVSAISGVIGNFQMAKMETTLNAIEEGTRYSALFLGGRADGGILGQLFRIIEEVTYGYTAKAMLEIRDIFKGEFLPRIANIDNSAYWGLMKLENLNNVVPMKLDQLIAKPTYVYVTNYLDSDQIASRVETRIENSLQLAIS
jgi:TP901 family phage tail tape measure protein